MYQTKEFLQLKGISIQIPRWSSALRLWSIYPFASLPPLVWANYTCGLQLIHIKRPARLYPSFPTVSCNNEVLRFCYSLLSGGLHLQKKRILLGWGQISPSISSEKSGNWVQRTTTPAATKINDLIYFRRIYRPASSSRKPSPSLSWSIVQPPVPKTMFVYCEL